MTVHFSFFKSEKPQRKILRPGRYQGILVSVRQGEKRVYTGEPAKETIVFRFQIGDTEALRTLNATTSPRGRLVEFVRSLTFKELSDKVLMDSDKFSLFLKSLEGERVFLDVVTSPCGRYNNIKGACPFTAQAA
jgi:hypothetical protein